MAGTDAAVTAPHEFAVQLVGDDLCVPCLDGRERPYLNLDAAASTGALPAVAERVSEFLPWYSSVHRGAGYKSQLATAAYEDAREAIRCFAGRSERDDVAIICRKLRACSSWTRFVLRWRPGRKPACWP